MGHESRRHTARQEHVVMDSQMKLKRRTFLLLATAPFVAGCSKSGKRDANTARMQLNWYPEAEHGGFYAALVHGNYRDQGVEVDILPGTPNTKVSVQVATGRAEFGILSADELLQSRAQGMDLVAVMAAMQSSPNSIIVHRESGIEAFDQLKKLKTLAVATGRPYADFLKKHVDLSDVKIVSYQGSISPFLASKDYGQQGYLFSEPYLIEQRGQATNVLKVADLGFNPYTSVLFVDRSLMSSRPDYVRKVVRASVDGWKRYLAEPTDANQLIQKLNPEMTAEALAYGAAKLRDLVLPDPGVQVGAMTEKRWTELTEQMIEIGHLEQAKSTGSAFSNEFLRSSA
jgi:NitT/TauT family transport system substrate-binding protein